MPLCIDLFKVTLRLTRPPILEKVYILNFGGPFPYFINQIYVLHFSFLVIRICRALMAFAWYYPSKIPHNIFNLLRLLTCHLALHRSTQALQ